MIEAIFMYSGPQTLLILTAATDIFGIIRLNVQINMLTGSQ